MAKRPQSEQVKLLFLHVSLDFPPLCSFSNFPLRTPNQLSVVSCRLAQLELIIYTNCQFGRASNVRQQSVECVVKCKIWSKVCRGISQTCSHFIASLSLQIRLRLRHRQTRRASQMIRQRAGGVAAAAAAGHGAL